MSDTRIGHRHRSRPPPRHARRPVAHGFPAELSTDPLDVMRRAFASARAAGYPSRKAWAIGAEATLSYMSPRAAADWSNALTATGGRGSTPTAARAHGGSSRVRRLNRRDVRPAPARVCRIRSGRTAARMSGQARRLVAAPLFVTICPAPSHPSLPCLQSPSVRRCSPRSASNGRLTAELLAARLRVRQMISAQRLIRRSPPLYRRYSAAFRS